MQIIFETQVIRAIISLLSYLKVIKKKNKRLLVSHYQLYKYGVVFKVTAIICNVSESNRSWNQILSFFAVTLVVSAWNIRRDREHIFKKENGRRTTRIE